MTETTQQSDFHRLNPDAVLAAVEDAGVPCDGRLLALNSYENRVYQVGLEDQGFVIAKFYRPRRWSDQQIIEEHDFSLQLAEAEIPVVAPLADSAGRTLRNRLGYRFALYPRRGGRWPELDDDDTLRWLGRLLGRMHALGRVQPFRYRPRIDVDSLGGQARNWLLEHDVLPADLRPAWDSVSRDLLSKTADAFARIGTYTELRLHGDCHPGNILWTDEGPHFVDLDDCRTGPAIQDLWMLLSGERAEQAGQLGVLLEGYSQFSDFDPRELHLLEPLRALRLLNYSAWIARRWQDPAFPLAFPWFAEPRYWEQQILSLREQMAVLDEPPLPI